MNTAITITIIIVVAILIIFFTFLYFADRAAQRNQNQDDLRKIKELVSIVDEWQKTKELSQEEKIARFKAEKELQREGVEE